MPCSIVYYTDSSSFGGAEQVLLTLISGLDRGDWEPVLFHHAEPGLAPLLEQAAEQGVRLRCLPHLPLGIQGARQLPLFIQALRSERPEIFHANLTHPLSCKWGLVGASLSRAPAIVATEHLFVQAPYTRASRLQQRLIATQVDRYLAVSRDTANQLQRVFGIPEGKFTVIQNGIPVDETRRPADPRLRAALSIPGTASLILTTARLDPQKGLSYLLEAAAQVPQAVFAIAGDGPERDRLEAQARQLGLQGRMFFLGFRENIPDWLAACDLFVLPSLYEGLPLSVLEAMAAGKPVIASAICGIQELVTHQGNGWLVPPADPQSLAQAIQTLLDDPPLANRLALAGQDQVRRGFSVERMVREVTGVYEGLLSRRETEHGPL